MGSSKDASGALLRAINLDLSLLYIQICQGRLCDDLDLLEKYNTILNEAYKNKSSTIGNQSEIMVDYQ